MSGEMSRAVDVELAFDIAEYEVGSGHPRRRLTRAKWR
jgi:hypothetical protein